MDYKDNIIITSLPDENDKIDGSTNKPKIRHDKIIKLFRDKGGFSMMIPKMELTHTMLENLNVHKSDYLEFLRDSYVSFKDNYDADFDPNKDGGLIPYYFSNRILNTRTKLPMWKKAGYYCTDVTTPIYENTYKNSMMSANISYVAAKFIDNYNLIYCLNMYPGHHASSDQMGGYCYLNNAAICAKQYQQRNAKNKIKPKVAILDLDYHAAQGTQEIFYDDPTVYNISIHADPYYVYPNQCFEDELGDNEGVGYNKNIIFSKQVKGDEYLDIVKQAITIINNFDPELVIIPFGGDTFKLDKDPSRLYTASLELEDYYDIGQELKKINRKMIITQEGGYDMENISKIVDNFISGIIS